MCILADVFECTSPYATRYYKLLCRKSIEATRSFLNVWKVLRRIDTAKLKQHGKTPVPGFDVSERGNSKQKKRRHSVSSVPDTFLLMQPPSVASPKKPLGVLRLDGALVLSRSDFSSLRASKQRASPESTKAVSSHRTPKSQISTSEKQLFCLAIFFWR